MTEKDVEIVSAVIDKEKENLDELSMNIWKNPELKYQEVYAHDQLTNALENYGFSVQRKYLLDTAFRAEYSRGDGSVVAVLCEYDALPDVGHACGHNLIAMSGVAAGVGIKAAMEADPTLIGKVVVLGCPAEEGGAGKVRLVERGAFEGIDAALMAHPTISTRGSSPALCNVKVAVKYIGKEAHASAFPWEGKNALDAVVAAYVNIGLLRQHITPNCRIHSIITNGGSAVNVIPGETEMEMMVRAPTAAELAPLKERVRNCLESAAQATGCQLECRFLDEDTYLNVIANKVLVSLYKEYTKKFGIEHDEDNPEKQSSQPETAGSTDMGNVSYVVPSIHPFYNIGPEVNHTKGFTEQSATDLAHQMARTVAKGLALTAVRLMRCPEILKEAKHTFLVDVEKNKGS